MLWNLNSYQNENPGDPRRGSEQMLKTSCNQEELRSALLAIAFFLVNVLLTALLRLLSRLLALLSLAMLSGLTGLLLGLSGLSGLIAFLIRIVRHETPPQKTRLNHAFLVNCIAQLVDARDCEGWE
jgi:hypothetical protein